MIYYIDNAYYTTLFISSQLQLRHKFSRILRLSEIKANSASQQSWSFGLAELNFAILATNFIASLAAFGRLTGRPIFLTISMIHPIHLASYKTKNYLFSYNGSWVHPFPDPITHFGTL